MEVPLIDVASPEVDEPSGAEAVEAVCTSRQRKATDLQLRARAFHKIFEAWLDEPGATVACGRWSDGAISELMLTGRAQLLPERYEGPFVGIRKLQLADSSHHLHVDLGRVARIDFAVAPSVCLGFRPAFEVRLLTNTEPHEWLVALMLPPPYIGEQVDLSAARRFFERACQEVNEHPELAAITLAPELSASSEGQQLLRTWHKTSAACLTYAPDARPNNATSVHPTMAPACFQLLTEALELKDASLVIFRERTLVEFKTDYLDGVHRYEKHGHVSWQLGAYHHHHCHLALDAVIRVEFSAEPVPCQGGGLNYTIWFLTDTASGNPYRSDGYFSITLNRPYLQNAKGAAPRLAVIQPVLDLYRRHQDQPWVSADLLFNDVLRKGPPSRPRKPAGSGRPKA
ncbi:MAG: hypothetical protein JF586_15305 [Burkholderiales bacterium]|jgi:hypothetical protein|nr:hypothetical protein [Burkholderiales bacterium]